MRATAPAVPAGNGTKGARRSLGAAAAREWTAPSPRPSPALRAGEGERPLWGLRQLCSPMVLEQVGRLAGGELDYRSGAMASSPTISPLTLVATAAYLLVWPALQLWLSGDWLWPEGWIFGLWLVGV